MTMDFRVELTRRHGDSVTHRTNLGIVGHPADDPCWLCPGGDRQ